MNLRRWRLSSTVPAKFAPAKHVFIKARRAALARPLEALPGRPEALQALEPELELEEGLGLPCTQKKSQAGTGQARAARWIQRPGLLLQPRRQMLYSFFYFRNPDGKNYTSS
jgi:hypothetical protein